MNAIPILCSAHFASDQAAPCTCGSTIAAYRIEGTRVDVQCAACHQNDSFFPDRTPETAAEMSAAHRFSRA